MNLKLIIKGFIIGIAKIIPGVSGAMLAITLGIYEDLINAVTHFFDNVKYNSKIICFFGIGVFIAIVFFSKFIMFLLNRAYFETIYLFLGLIIGTLIPFSKELKFTKKNTILFSITLVLFFSLTFFSTNTLYVFTGKVIDYIYVIFLGSVDAATSIVPGISGTAIYLLLGVYEYVLSVLATPFSLEFIMYTFGLVIGIIITCYFMQFILKKWSSETKSILFAFMIGSMLLLLKNVITAINAITIFFFIIGILIGKKFDKA